MGGVMVTASHSPADHNGFKLVLQGQRLRRRALRALFAEEPSGLRPAGDLERADLRPAYLTHLALEGLAAPALRVGWDPGNGAAAALLSALLRRLPGEHHVINGEVDGRFPAHHPDPSRAVNLRQLRELVLERRLDLGFAFDGDGDRLGAVDGQGRILWGDDLLALLARDLLRRRPGATIVADVKASQRLFDQVRAWGGRAVMSRTGHGYVLETLQAEGAALGGEVSAHFFFQDRGYGYDDGLLAAVKVLAALGRSGESLATFLDSLPPTATSPTLRIFCPDADKADAMRALEDLLVSDGQEVKRLDGLRVAERDGWWLLRPSNTEPCLVLRCEAKTQAACTLLLARISAALSSLGLPQPEA